MIERRKENRYVEKNLVLIWPESDEDGSPAVNAYTFDISTGGARIYAQDFFKVGTLVKLQIHLARSRQSIMLPAEVKWARAREDAEGSEIGVEFRHQITATLVALIRHLYTPDEAIPASIA
jgi:Tfp pilus assembly protein PilZ